MLFFSVRSLPPSSAPARPFRERPPQQQQSLRKVCLRVQFLNNMIESFLSLFRSLSEMFPTKIGITVRSMESQFRILISPISLSLSPLGELPFRFALFLVT